MNKERLLKLAEHLEKGQLSVQVFSLRHYREKISCGFAGCAIGELPAAFPGIWAIEMDETMGFPFWKEKDPRNKECVSDAACEFLDIDYDEFIQLFYQDRDTMLGVNHPDANRNAKTVAAEIRKFVEFGNVHTAIRAVREEMSCR